MLKQSFGKILAAASTLVVAALCTPAIAKENAPRPTPAAATQASAPQQALWVMRDADSTIYLYGTIHLRKAGADWGGPAAKAALAEAQEVWTELEIDPAKEAQMQGLVMQFGIDPARKLSDRIDPAQKPALEAAAKALGAPLANLEPMKPWLASLTFQIAPMLQAGYTPDSGVDRQIDTASEAAGKKMRWFETASEQLQFLAGLSEPVQLQMLYESLGDLSRGPQMLKQMEALWETGDADGLYALTGPEMRSQYPELYDVILTQRNKRWADVLATEMQGSGVDFVAVGALHLLGEDSVQTYLERKGFKVERVK